MADKDLWDKSEVIIKLIGSVVLVAIPVMISIGANRISQSMERGKLVESLLSELTNEQVKMRRDLALIALDAAVPPPEKCKVLGVFKCSIDETRPDMVAEVAVVLWRQLDDRSESTQAAKIIIKRKPTTHTAILTSDVQVTSAPDPVARVDTQESKRIAQKAEIVSRLVVQPVERLNQVRMRPDAALAGVKAVYVQYRDDRKAAEQIRDALLEKGVSVPRLELVPGIRQNDIRYSSPDEREAAQRLRDFLHTDLQIQINDDKLIDLSGRGYKAPPGQFEVWING